MLEPILEEFVEFVVYPDPEDVEKARRKYLDDDKGKERGYRDYILALRLAIISKSHGLVQKYLWFNQAFNLLPCPCPAETYLKGRLVFGDGIEDEWFVTFILLEVSKVLPGVIITVEDADGQFLLIEAAEYLPNWLEPDTSANRVFIHRGKVHIVSINDMQQASLEESLNFIRRNPTRTVANDQIQRCIQEKVERFKDGKQDLHHCRVVLPHRIASSLQKFPQIVSRWLIEYYMREPAKLQHACDLSRACIGGNLDMKSIRVAFTRTQFAQLLCQQIHPPKGYPMPAEDSLDYLAYSVGLKLTLGALMSISNGDSADKAIERSDISIKLLKDHFGVENEPIEVSIPSTRALFEDPLDVIEYSGPDDDLTWLNIEEGPLMNEINEQMRGLELSEMDKEDILQSMLDEEDEDVTLNPRLIEFLKQSSGFEGIYNDKVHDLDDESDESEYSSSEEDDELITREVLEAIMMDPDLLMRLLAQCGEGGDERANLLRMIAGMKKEDITKISSIPQKGIADINPEKLAEARRRSRPLPPEVLNDMEEDDDDCIDISEGQMSSSDDEDYYGSEEIPSPLTKEVHVNPSSDEERVTEGENLSMGEYMKVMDAELTGSALDRDLITKSMDNLSKSAQADNSPTHGIILSM